MYTEWNMVDMIDINDVPESGLLIISVFFKGYEDSYQNDSRRKLRNRIPRIDEKHNLDINLKPLQFCLIRAVVKGIGRSIGAEYHYSFKNMTPEKFKTLYKEINDVCQNFNIWSSHSILFADYVSD